MPIHDSVFRGRFLYQAEGTRGHSLFIPNPQIDIAVAPFLKIMPAGTDAAAPYFLPIEHGMLPTAEQLSKLDMIEEILFVGYPAGYYDRKNLMPITRQGITASPIQLDYDGRPEFLVDGSVYFGSSGSPVFLLRQGIYVEEGRSVNGPNKFLFLGIISEALRVTFDGQIGFIHPMATSEGVAAARLLNLGAVLKSHLVNEAVEYAAVQIGA